MQHLQGGEIETGTPVFDVDCATLMDVTVMSANDAQKGRVHFVYVLPLANNRALIQDTFLCLLPIAVRMWITAPLLTNISSAVMVCPPIRGSMARAAQFQ
jgi:hypothetical protein